MKSRQVINATAKSAGDRGPAGTMHQMHGLQHVLALTTAVILLAGCASSTGIAPVAQMIGSVRAGANGPLLAELPAAWWREFGDRALIDLVERALADSPTLKIAQARIERASATAAVARAADGPQLNGEIDITRQKFSANSIYPPPLGGSVQTLGTAQIRGSWELDFFGRNRAAIEAAVGAQRAAQADRAAAQNMLATNVARTYVQLGRLFDQRDVAVRSLQQRDAMLDLIRQRVSGGLETNVELRQGEGALPETRQQIEQLDEQIALSRHALAALTAQPPSALDPLQPQLNTLRSVPLPALVPADLLGRRADIVAARWRIEGATSETRSAKAQFYPNINLSAFVGLASIGLSRLLDTGSGQFGAGPALRLPIFDAGRLRANLRVKTADVDAAVESYNGAVLDAIHDVADQISSLRAIERQQREQISAQGAAESAYDLATQRYKAGLSTYLTVLNAEVALLNQRRLAAELKGREIETQIALIRALGGGYLPDAQLATANLPAAQSLSSPRI